MSKSPDVVAEVFVRQLPKSLDCAYIYPIGDIHTGDPASNTKKLKGYLEWILSVPNAFIILMGDLANVAICDSVSDTYSETEHPGDQYDSVVDLFRPAAKAGRILGMISGNHERRIYRKTGIDISKLMARELGVPYSPDEMWLKITLGRKRGGNQKRVAYTCYMTHGFGGGRLKGSKLNKVVQLAEITNVDVYFMAHTHQIGALPDDYYVVDAKNNVVLRKKRLFVSTGGFLDRKGYAVQFGFSPTHSGSPRVRLDGTRKDAHCSV